MLTLRTGGFFRSRTHFPTSVNVAAKLGPAGYGGNEGSTGVVHELHFFDYSVDNA